VDGLSNLDPFDQKLFGMSDYGEESVVRWKEKGRKRVLKVGPVSHACRWLFLTNSHWVAPGDGAGYAWFDSYLKMYDPSPRPFNEKRTSFRSPRPKLVIPCTWKEVEYKWKTITHEQDGAPPGFCYLRYPYVLTSQLIATGEGGEPTGEVPVSYSEQGETFVIKVEGDFPSSEPRVVLRRVGNRLGPVWEPLQLTTNGTLVEFASSAADWSPPNVVGHVGSGHSFARDDHNRQGDWGGSHVVFPDILMQASAPEQKMDKWTVRLGPMHWHFHEERISPRSEWRFRDPHVVIVYGERDRNR
jgi:hypothetical protein